MSPPEELHLPPDLLLERVLVRSQRSTVLRVRRGDGCFVLRIGGDAELLSAEVAPFSRIDERGLVAPTEWGTTDDGLPYVLRPFVEGVRFDEAVRRAPVERVADWTASLLGTLAAMHDAGLVHRDVKASNVIVGDTRVHLIDLDLTRAAGQGGAAGGTCFHIAPEVLARQPHRPQADLFSAGAMLAYALLGEPDAHFHERFPTQSFWSATQLDPADLPPPLAPLVRALVRRHPETRPPCARSAMALLPERSVAEPLRRTLPFTAGRREVVEAVVRALAEGPRLCVIALADVYDRDGVVEELSLLAALDGRSVETVEVGCSDRRSDSGALGRVLVASTDSVSVGTEFLRSALARTEHSAVLVAAEASAARVLRGVRAELLAEESSRVMDVLFPRTPATALHEHLNRLSDGASPTAAGRLARSLHVRTGGRLHEIQRCLERAELDGVMRWSGTAYALLLDEWPAAPVLRAAGDEILAELGDGARRLLESAAVLARPARLRQLARAADLDADAAAAALAELHAAGIVAAGVGPDRRVLFSDPRWTSSAYERLGAAERRRLHARCAELLADEGDPAAVAGHRLAGAAGAEDFEAVLETAEDERRAGRLGTARRLARGVAEHSGARHAALRERAAVLVARLEIGQDDAEQALATLEHLFGDDLSDASVEATLVAAQAAEQCGQRARARGLYERVLDAVPDRDSFLRATVGVAYGVLLDGNYAGALERTRGLPLADDPDEAAGTLLNLRGGTLAELGRLDEASAELDAAMERACACGDPTLLGRTELNRAYVHRRRGCPLEAVAALERARAAFDRAGHLKLRSLACNNLGVLHRDLGELSAARALVEESLSLRRRIGDAHGTAVAMGNRGILALDAGELGAALLWLGRASALMERGRYEAERGLVEAHAAVALALCGRLREARSALRSESVEGVKCKKPLLVARAAAVIEFCAGRSERAEAHLRKALEATAGDLAESFRAARLWLALRGDCDEARAILEHAARELESSVRQAEYEWFARDRRALAGIERLGAWLEQFEEAGRTDLAHAVAGELARALHEAGRKGERRLVMSRSRAATDALLDGVEPQLRPGALERVLQLAAQAPQGPPSTTIGVEWLLRWNRRLAQEQDLDELLSATIDMALDVSEARGGFLVLLDGDAIETLVARGIDHENLLPEEVLFSRTVVREAIASQRPVLAADASRDLRFTDAESIQSLEMRSILCVPLPSMEGWSGALYLDGHSRESAFDDFDAEAVASLADQVAIAVINLRRQAEVAKLNARLRDQLAFRDDELARMRSMIWRRGTVPPVGGLIGESAAMRDLCQHLVRFASTELPVLLSGPRGSDVANAARALHEHSPRSEGPFVTQNLAALPAEAIEEELFGVARGAFEGAGRSRLGLLAKAEGGTLFLDAIEELPAGVQRRFTDALEAGSYRPVAARKSRPCDVRLVSATQCDLVRLVREARFLEELYHYINAVEITVPSLADRVEDIPALVQHFVDGLNRRHGTDKAVSAGVVAALARRPWPGELRELSNEVSRLFFQCEASLDQPELVRAPEQLAPSSEAMPASFRLEDIERAAIARALEATGQNKERAARLLGISRAGLYKKLRRLGLDRKKA